MDFSEIATYLLNFLMPLVKNHPVLMAVVMFMGTARLIMKPLVAAIEKIVKDTPSPKDDAIVAKIEASMPWKVFNFLIDYFASVKTPTEVKASAAMKSNSGL